MLTFLSIFAVALLVLLLAQYLDIEQENPRVVRRKAPDASFPPFAAMREIR